MVLITLEPPTSSTRRFGRLLARGGAALNFGLGKAKAQLAPKNLRLLIQRPKNRQNTEATRRSTEEDTILPKFNPELLYTSSKFESCSKSAFLKGCPIYEKFYTCQDFTYNFTCSSVKFDTTQIKTELQLRKNLSRVPWKENRFEHIVDGLVFKNNCLPIVVPGNENGPISKWFVVFSMNRSFIRSKFDAEISVSCESSRDGCEQNFQIGLQLQVLQPTGKIFCSKICENRFRNVSATNIARFHVPNVLDLSALPDPKNDLIHDSKCCFNIIITYLVGQENDAEIDWESSPVVASSLLHPDIINEEIAIKTMTGTLLVQLNYLPPALLNCISDDGTINLINFSKQAVINLLRFHVCEKIKTNMWTTTMMLETLQLAHQLKNWKLKRCCLAAMSENLNPEYAAMVLLTAFVFGAEENLRLRIKQYFIRNIGAIRKAASTQTYIRNYPRAFAEIIFGPTTASKIQSSSLNNYGIPTRTPLSQFLKQAFSSLAQQ